MSTIQTLSSGNTSDITPEVMVIISQDPSGQVSFSFNPAGPITVQGSGKVKYTIQGTEFVFVGAKFYKDDDDSVQSVKIKTSASQSSMTIKATNESKTKQPDDIQFTVIAAARNCDATGSIYESQDPQIVCIPT